MTKGFGITDKGSDIEVNKDTFLTRQEGGKVILTDSGYEMENIQ